MPKTSVAFACGAPVVRSARGLGGIIGIGSCSAGSSASFVGVPAARPLAARRARRETPPRMQQQQDGDGADAEDEAPSDSFVPPGAAAAVLDAATGGPARRAEPVAALLALAAATARGQYATAGQRARVDALVATLEELNPNAAPVETDLIDGEWSLVFGPVFFGKSPLLAFAAKPVLQVGQVRQTIAVDDGRLVNEVDLVAFPEVSLVVKTTARLTPVGGEKLELNIEKTTVTGGSIADRFDLGGLSFDVPVERLYQRVKGTAPESFLETTYLDDNLRISRSKDRKLYVYTRL